MVAKGRQQPNQVTTVKSSKSTKTSWRPTKYEFITQRHGRFRVLGSGALSFPSCTRISMCELSLLKKRDQEDERKSPLPPTYCPGRQKQSPILFCRVASVRFSRSEYIGMFFHMCVGCRCVNALWSWQSTSVPEQLKSCMHQIQKSAMFYLMLSLCFLGFSVSRLRKNRLILCMTHATHSPKNDVEPRVIYVYICIYIYICTSAAPPVIESFGLVF